MAAHRAICNPDHFEGPGGDIYTMIAKAQNTDTSHGFVEVDHLIGPGGDVYAAVSKPGRTETANERRETVQKKSGGGCPYEEFIPEFEKREKGIAMNIYESLETFEANKCDSRSPLTPGKALTSEEERRLQDMLDDLLGMADDFCSTMDLKNLSTCERSAEPSKTLNTQEGVFFESKQLNSNTVDSSDSGFHQQMAFDEGNFVAASQLSDLSPRSSDFVRRKEIPKQMDGPRSDEINRDRRAAESSEAERSDLYALVCKEDSEGAPRSNQPRPTKGLPRENRLFDDLSTSALLPLLNDHQAAAPRNLEVHNHGFNSRSMTSSPATPNTFRRKQTGINVFQCSNCRATFEDQLDETESKSEDSASLLIDVVPSATSGSASSLINAEATGRFHESGNDAMERRFGKKCRREEEIVTLRPIGVHTLEAGRPNRPVDVDANLAEFYEKNNSLSGRHAPLVKSFSSGYHGYNPRNDEIYEDNNVDFHSPQLGLDVSNGRDYLRQRRMPANFQSTPENVVHQNGRIFLHHHDHHHQSHTNDLFHNKFGQQLDNNNNNHDISNSIHNNIINNRCINNSLGRFPFKREAGDATESQKSNFRSAKMDSLDSVNFSSRPGNRIANGPHSAFPLSHRAIPALVSRDLLSSTMPRSMKIITPNYRQFSRPGLTAGFSVDSKLNPLEAVMTPCFVTDQSKRWYHPTMSRERAMKLLVNKPAGSFIVRASSSFEGAYGLVLKVDTLPDQVQSGSSYDYVRHFLIETTPSGVRIKGSPVEPTFGSLATLVYQHMLTALSLPCRLLLDKYDADFDVYCDDDSNKFSQGMEELFYYLNGEGTESLTGQVAMVKVINKTFSPSCMCHFKVTKVKLKLDSEGMTLTDLDRKLFFRKKYRWDCISYSGVDNSNRAYFAKDEDGSHISLGRLFCVVVRNGSLAAENVCHILASRNVHDDNFVPFVDSINDKTQELL